MSEETQGHHGLSDIISMPKMYEHSNWVWIYALNASLNKDHVPVNKQLFIKSWKTIFSMALKKRYQEKKVRSQYKNKLQKGLVWDISFLWKLERTVWNHV